MTCSASRTDTAAARAVAPLIDFRGITKRFGGVAALDGIDLAIAAGEFFALLGPSGCGKTTLLRILAGFEAPTTGTVALAGIDLAGVPPHRRALNLMFQSYALFPHMSVQQNIAFGLKMEGMRRDAIARRVGAMVELVQLGGCETRMPHQISGGQRQRVALARALAKQPKVLLLDEPLSALDRKLRGETRRELTRIQKELGITFVLVTHDQEEALSLSDRIAVMNRGRIEQVGTPADIYERPASRYVAGFMGTINLLEARMTGRDDTCIHLDVAGTTIAHENGTDLSAGTPVCLAIRPEDLTIKVAGSAADTHDNSIAGVLIDVAYLGERSMCSVAIYDGRTMHVSVPGRRPGPGTLAIGAAVQLTFGRAAGWLLTR